MTRLQGTSALLALLLAAGSVLAQGTGSLEVFVIDDAGLPLPGATVVLSHRAGNVKPYAVKTDGKGRALFPVLRPGKGYVVEVSMPSFGTRREEDVHVPIADSATVAIQLSEEMVEHIRVVTDNDVVELETTSSSSRFSDEFMQDLPIAGRFYQNLLTLAPGVNDPDGDGNPTVHGSRSRDFQAKVSGVSNVDPLTGQFMSLINSDSIEEMEVVTGGAGVEFGRAQGGFARIIQKQGTNEFEGTFGLLFRSSKLDGDGARDTSALPDPGFGEIHPSLQVSGPIIRDRLWYRLSHEVLEQEIPINTVGQLVTQDVRQRIHADQLTWQVSPRNKLAFQFQSDPLEVSNFGVSSNRPAESSQTISTESTTYSIVWTAPYSPTLLIETIAAWQELESSILPSQTDGKNRCIDGNPFFEDTLCRNNATQQISGPHFISNRNNSQRFTLTSQATLYGGQIWGANHQFKFGISVENERYFRRLERRPEIQLDIITPLSDEAGETPEEIKIITATVGVPKNSQVRSTGTNWAVYFEDQIKPLNNLVITAGLRIDREELDAQGLEPLDPASEREAFFNALGGPLPTDRIFPLTFTRYEGIGDFLTELEGITGVSADHLLGNLANVTRQSGFWSKERQRENFNVANTNISPAISVSWDPWSSGKNKFAASARRYYDKIILAIPLIENNPALTTLVFDAVDTPRGELVATGLRNSINPAIAIEAVDRNLRTPYQDEWRVLYERELFTETLMRVEYINRKYRDQLQNIDINHAPGDFGTCRLATPNDPRGLWDSPGAGFELTDPYTGETFTDTDPGNGDGRLDDCVGDTDVFANTQNGVFLQRRDGIADLYTQNPSFGGVLVVGNFNKADYEAFVFELVRRQYRSWELQASYTWSMATGNGEDFRQFLGLDSSILDDEFGYQSNDQRHVVKASATTITPWGFRLGGRVTWSSGLPYSLLEQGLSFDAVPPAYLTLGSYQPSRTRLQYPTGRRNSARNDSQWLLDLKLTKEFNLGRGLNVQVTAEVFNLLNDGTYQVYNANLETGFQINGVDDARFTFGRRWQFGVRMAF